MTADDQGQDLADLEAKFEDSKQTRTLLENKFEGAKAKYRMTLVARRAAGEKLTVQDMDALIMIALDEVDYVKESYLDFVAGDTAYGRAKVNYEAGKRFYWDNKKERR